MLASENPPRLGSSGHTELADGALDGSVLGCQPQTFSRWESSATCSRVSLPPPSSLSCSLVPLMESTASQGMKVTRFTCLLPSRWRPLCKADRTSGDGRSQNGLRYGQAPSVLWVCGHGWTC